jgi:ribose transport system ATP-binding protein
MTITTATGLTAVGVSKSFYGNRVLDELALTIEPGTVHALLGHNGSGKSTFIKILAGYYEPDEGSGPVRVGEHELRPGDPDSSQAAGIAFVHQTLGLVPTLTVLENLRLGRPWETNAVGKIAWRRERANARAALEAFGLDGISPDALVGDLNTVEQTEVAIVRALAAGDDIRVLVLDEATAALTDQEVRKLFSILERVQERGVATLYVTHRLEEIPLVADEVTVLRDGRTVGQGPIDEFPRERLVSLITGGGESAAVETAADAPIVVSDGPPRLAIDGLRAGELVDGTLVGRGGEIVGVVGLLGSGVIDLAHALTGRIPVTSGTVELDGEPVDLGDFAGLSSRGISAVVGERSDRVAVGLSVAENLTLGTVPRFFRGGLLRRRELATAASDAVSRYEIRCAGPDAETASLSGGNQQKVAIAKVLAQQPKALVLEEPCHGVDERGRREIRSMLRAAAADGALVLVVDSDLDEILGLCTRIVVLREGRVAAELSPSGTGRQALLDVCYGTKEESSW